MRLVRAHELLQFVARVGEQIDGRNGGAMQTLAAGRATVRVVV
jgi:hypothetical protein